MVYDKRASSTTISTLPRSPAGVVPSKGRAARSRSLQRRPEQLNWPLKATAENNTKPTATPATRNEKPAPAHAGTPVGQPSSIAQVRPAFHRMPCGR